MFKKNLFIFLSICFLAASVFAYFYFREIKKPASNAISAIPADAILIIETNKVKDLWDKITSTNIIWEDLLEIDHIREINKDGKYIDSLIGLNPDLQEDIENKGFFISLHPVSENEADYLFILSVNPGLRISEVDDLVEKQKEFQLSLAKKIYRDAPFRTASFKNEKSSFSYALSGGL